MKLLQTIGIGLFIALFAACTSQQSLQEYYVDNSENPDFLSLDIPTSVLNLTDKDLTVTQKEALQSFKKLNILAFKKTDENDASFIKEKANVKAILKNSKFNELMKMNTGMGKASIQYLGEDDAIDEVVIYGNSEDKGFILIRVLGENMNPEHLTEFLSIIKNADFDVEQLKQFGSFFK